MKLRMVRAEQQPGITHLVCRANQSWIGPVGDECNSPAWVTREA